MSGFSGLDQRETRLDDHLRMQRQRERPLVVRLWRALQPLKSLVTFMNTGAHPDDETSDLLAALALREGMRTVFVCSTRGEGGQDALGTESGPDLGALRTREMEVAADALGLNVRWLSESPSDTITDFGFSKHPEEAFKKWGEDRTVERLVRVIRQERPDIVCPTFLDVSGQHGHHRAMTRAARRAIALAADPAACPNLKEEGLSPWQVSKFYLPAWSGAGQSYDDDVPPPNATVVVDTGGRDPVLGATYAQIAEWSRAGHKSQEMGKWLDPGPDSRPLHLAWSSLGETRDERCILDGLPRSLAELTAATDDAALHDFLGKADIEIAAALKAWPDAVAIGEAAARALAMLRTALPLASDAIRHRLAQKEAQLARVMFEASGIAVRAAALPAIAAPGSRVIVDVHVDTRDTHIDGAPRLSLRMPKGWSAAPAELAASGSFSLDVPDDASLSDGYPASFTPSGGNALPHVVVAFSVGGVEASQAIDLEEPLQVAPAVVVSAEPAAAILNIGRPTAMRFRVSAAPMASGTREVTIAPDLPDGWRSDPAKLELDLAGAQSVADVTIHADAGPGLHTIRLKADGAPALMVRRSGYRHTGLVVRSAPAVIRIRVLEASVPEEIRIGYAGGGNDRVDHWLRQLGLDVAPLDAATLANGDLSAFDTILVGIFAFGTRPELASAAGRLHDFVRAGGNLVTLYHRPWDGWEPDRIPPAFLRIGQPSLRWRVTDETAPVTILQPEHPLLNQPNRIVAEDWSGWHKERGLYLAAEWDPVYRPLVSMADPGEPPLAGALLAASIGRGRHTHASLVLHHQMEQLVPGAFRLMANLVTPHRVSTSAG